MKKLYVKQKMFSWNEQFTVKNEVEEDVYFIEGSMFKLPKTFTIHDANQTEIAQVIRKAWSFLPTFFVEIDGKTILTIKKEFTFFKAKYTLDMDGWEVHGDWWGMEFELQRQGETVGSVSKEWFSWGDAYEISMLDDPYLEKVMIALVVAVDCAIHDDDD